MLTRFSTSTTCPMCSSQLEWKNKRTGSVIGGLGGGVGGGLGALLGELWVWTGDTIYLVLIILLIVGVFFAALGAVAKYTESRTEKYALSLIHKSGFFMLVGWIEILCKGIESGLNYQS